MLTLDAGGTNIVFSALRSNRQVVAPIPLPAEPDNLDRCLEVLVRGFERVSSQLGERPVAISFAFPGPADYANGIIGTCPIFRPFGAAWRWAPICPGTSGFRCSWRTTETSLRWARLFRER